MGFGRGHPALALSLVLALGGSAQVFAADSSWLAKPMGELLVGEADLACLGWSRSGACALLERLDSGERGGYALRLLLLDSVEDTGLFKQDLWSDELGLDSDDPEALAEGFAAGETGMAFAAACARSMVEVGSGDGGISTFPLAYKGSSFSAALKSAASRTAPSESEAAAMELGASKLDLLLTVRREGRGSKTVSSLRGVMASGLGVDGYFKSPFEPRILVVFETRSPGFEGDEARSLRYAGCQLEAGFK